MKYLLDTSVYSQALSRKPVMPALENWNKAGDEHCVTSVVCKAEVEWGLWKNPNRKRDEYYKRLFRHRLEALPTTQDIWELFSRMKARQAVIGQPVSDFDLLIAATAMRHGLHLATLNIRDFSRIEGLSWLDWSK